MNSYKVTIDSDGFMVEKHVTQSVAFEIVGKLMLNGQQKTNNEKDIVATAVRRRRNGKKFVNNQKTIKDLKETAIKLVNIKPVRLINLKTNFPSFTRSAISNHMKALVREKKIKKIHRGLWTKV